MLRARSCALLLTAAILLLVPFIGLRHSPSLATHLGYHVNQTHFQEPKLTCEAEPEWHFSVTRDSRNRVLSDYQCDSAFPDLWQELHRAKNWHVEQRKGGLISKSDIDQYDGRAQLRLMIYNGQLRIMDDYALSGPHVPDRPLATLQAINRAINALSDPGSVPNIEFTIDTQDDSLGGGPNATIWSYCRPKESLGTWIMPDFGFWSYPTRTVGSYDEFLERVNDADEKGGFIEKENGLVWRGSKDVSPGLRSALVKSAEGVDWAREVKFLQWDDPKTFLNMHEHCRFRFAAHTEGITWSGRLRYLQNCNNVIVSHKLDYIAHYYPLMVSSGPDQNFVEVERDFSDLHQKIEPLIQEPELAATIAENGRRVFRDRYLTPAAEACYWRRMFKVWSEVQGWEVQGWEMEDGERRMRGIAYEQYAVTGKNWGENAPP